MGPRCSSAETQVCHSSYIIAAIFWQSVLFMEMCVQNDLCTRLVSKIAKNTTISKQTHVLHNFFMMSRMRPGYNESVHNNRLLVEVKLNKATRLSWITTRVDWGHSLCGWNPPLWPLSWIETCVDVNTHTHIYIYIYIYGADVVEWSRALDIRLSDWCCSVSMVSVQIPLREEQKIDSSKI